jgi:hypothetical protein
VIEVAGNDIPYADIGPANHVLRAIYNSNSVAIAHTGQAEQIGANEVAHDLVALGKAAYANAVSMACRNDIGPNDRLNGVANVDSVPLVDPSK